MKNLLFILLVLTFFQAFSQNVDEKSTKPAKADKPCLLKISSLNIGFDRIGIKNYNNNFESFKNSVPNNASYFKTNLSNYIERGSPIFHSTQYNMSVGFEPYSSKNSMYNNKRELRVGISYSSGSRDNFSFTRTHKVPADTFKSSTQSIYSGSLKSSTIKYSVIQDEYALDISYLYKTDPEEMFSFYTGYGISSGFSGYSELRKNAYKSIRTYYDLGEVTESPAIDKTKQVIYYNRRSEKELNHSVLFRPYIPLGINFKPCKNQKLLSHMNIYLQAQAGIEYQQLIHGANYFSPFVGGGAGIKYNF